MKILVVGPSDTKSRGGMAAVISGIRKSKLLNSKYDIDIFESYIDGNILLRLFFSVYAYLKFLGIYKKYDVFHLHTASKGSTFRKKCYAYTAKKACKKVIVHIHGSNYLDFYEGLSDRLKRKVRDFLNSADLVIALSNGLKEKFEEIFGLDNCEVLNNGIDTEKFREAVCGMEENRNSFALMGRLGKRKGAYDLVNACEKAVKENPDIKIYMAGDGEVEKVKALVKEKGLEKNIDVIGWIGFDDKIKLLKKVSTVVLPSYNEGLPMSVLEGMAAGKAIISTSVGAIPEVIKDENGLLIEPGDIESLSDALLKCSTDVEMIKGMSEKNRNKTEEMFSVERMHEKLSEYYSLMEEK